MNSQGFLHTEQTRNCFRCQQDFRAKDNERVCPTCRLPRLRYKDSESPLGKALSPREKQLVRLLMQAKANKQIAFELHLTTGTVKVYFADIFAKLGMGNRTEVAMWGVSHPGDISLPSENKEEVAL